ncbi:MAG: hypothetical protein RMZ41_029730 [Nostoc sp. DedVER02]|uniref:hypothetical protein n=1 Tax=unclassified Nostoc TaxID=2593658 RepID=UPI002AD1E827|nr:MULTISPECIES: hypothetical protein [unclassified Nostoc]MDZ7986409.1 hypothetical protein [Nostoc sp. DedVER02]MDZ8111947.1 hypothetical protein [Nostoc sp. DedVER01b]
MKTKTITYIYAFSFLFIWNAFAAKIILQLLLNIKFIPADISYMFINTITFIILFEVVAKIAFLSTISSKLNFTTTQLEALSQIDAKTFNYYTNALESLGFARISDLELSESTLTVARVFCHPKHFCFAEVVQTPGRSSVFCDISSGLEQEWSVSFRDNSPNLAIVYAFLRCPRGIIVVQQGVTPEELLRSHLKFRQKIMHDLNLQLLPDISIEAYFDQVQRGRTSQRKLLSRKSVIVGMVEMWLFSFKTEVQKSQWLGDYARLAAR